MIPQRLLLASANADKVAEWRALAPEVDWWTDPELPSPDETGASVAENAEIKARAAASARGAVALGDDVGLWVDALGGGPGLDLKPWAMGLGGWGAARNALAAVAGSPATYRCGLALALPAAPAEDGRQTAIFGARAKLGQGPTISVIGEVRGTIGPPSGDGPGVEPCFRPEGADDTLSRLAPAERARHHHRHRAWAALKQARLRAGDGGLVRLLLGVTGGIAAYKACEVASAAVKRGWEVRVAMTPNAVKFVGPVTFEALTNHAVLLDDFALGDPDPRSSVRHVAWAKWASVVMVAPASASFVGRLACGIASDALTTTLLALPAAVPVYVAPAMNTEMWNHPIVQRNLRWLEDAGRTRIVAPAEKRLACGDVGVGGLAEVPDLLAALDAHAG